MLLNGTKNASEGQNTNVLVNGNNNKVKFGVENAAILSGNGATALRTGEVIIGGSQDDGLNDSSNNLTQFITQTSTFHLTGVSNATIQYLTLSGRDGVYGIPMHHNSIGYIKGTAIGIAENNQGKYISEFTCTVSCNNSGVTDLQNFNNTEKVNTIGNNAVLLGVDGTYAESTTGNNGVYDTNQIYLIGGEALFGGTKKIAYSISINLVEQIHDLNTNITTH